MYKKPRPSQLRKIEALRRGRDKANASKPQRSYPPLLPDLRREVIVIDYDAGEPVSHTLRFFKTRGVDRYRVEADGAPWKSCGWSSALAGLRRAYQRVPSPRSDFWFEG
jgi:hypothetical protein